MRSTQTPSVVQGIRQRRKWGKSQLDGRISKPSPGRSWSKRLNVSEMGFFICKMNATVSCAANLLAGNTERGEDWKIRNNQQENGSVFRKEPQVHVLPGEMEGGTHNSLLALCTGK